MIQSRLRTVAVLMLLTELVEPVLKLAVEQRTTNGLLGKMAMKMQKVGTMKMEKKLALSSNSVMAMVLRMAQVRDHFGHTDFGSRIHAMAELVQCK